MSYDYDDYYDEERSKTGLLLGLAALLLSTAVLAWIFVIPRFQDESVSSTQTVATDAPDATDTPDSTDTANATDTPNASDTPEATDTPGATDVADSIDEAGASIGSASSVTTTTAAIRTTTSGAPTATDPSPAPAATTYPTLPDGSPVPVLAVFDKETITLSGVVPSEKAATQLEGLAIANSKFPEAKVVSNLTLDPTIPSNVGVRVVEMNSVRFPESTADLLPEHRAEIDRVAGILSLFPNVSVLVIGHADQRGSAEANFKISEERARAVSTYLVSTGLDPARVSSRAVGALDLLALGNDNQSFALNRRTEFVFYGLLTEPE